MIQSKVHVHESPLGEGVALGMQRGHDGAPDIAIGLDVLDEGEQDGLVGFGVPVLKDAPSTRGGSGLARSVGFLGHFEAE